MTRATMPVVERELRIEAIPAIVFTLLTDAQKLTRWMGKSATVEPYPGGRFRIDYNGTDIASGRFLEVVENERVVFTWGWEAEGSVPPPGASTVEITLRPDGDATVLRLIHRDLPAEVVASHREGWDYFLPRLVSAVRQ